MSSSLRHHIHEVIFEADTPAGKAFDVALLVCIVLSVVVVMLESVQAIRLDYGPALRAIEWVLTLLFTIEYVLRLVSVTRPWRYARSFYGIVDLLSILPTYLSLFIGGAQSLIVIRALRLLRVFRVFKLAQYVGEAAELRAALARSRRKITIFIGTVVMLVVILGTSMYLIEGGVRGEASGFTSIPQSVYWAVVTLTTVGYGDVTPETVLGKMFATLIMLLGYGIIAVPTSIVTAEVVSSKMKQVTTQSCPACSAEGHDADARHCKFCGADLHPVRDRRGPDFD